MDYTDRIKPGHDSVRRFLEDLQEGKYQIPTFQREIVWEEDNVKKLWDSIYKFYPLGSILLWETNIPLQKHRKVGGHELKDKNGSEFLYILDGQQRTTSLLTSIYGGEIEGRPCFNPSLYIDLTVELTGETDDESYRSLFLFWKEIDDRGGELKPNINTKKRFDQGLIITLQDILERYGAVEERLNEAGYKYSDRPMANLRRIRDVFSSYQISHIKLRGIAVGEVCQIFERINQAGVPLDIFDIVVAKTFQAKDETTKETGFYLRDIFETFRSRVSSNYRYIDNHTMLQMLAAAIMLRVKDSGVANITDTHLNKIQTSHIREVWSDTERAILKVYDFLDNRLLIRGPGLVPSRYFYLSLMTYFLEASSPDYQFLEKYFWFYSFLNDDQLRSPTHLKQHVELLRKAAAGDTSVLGGFVIDKNDLRQAKYSTKGRYARAILALFASRQPRDWGPSHRVVLNDVYYSISDRPNLHHVFPINYIAEHPGTSNVDVNSLMNIAYLTQFTNQGVSDTNPLLYMQEFDKEEGFREVLHGHLMPLVTLEWAYAEEMPDNALDIFVEQRIEAIIAYLREKITGGRFDVVDSAEADVLLKVTAAVHPPASVIVARGEGEKVEFKETLRVNVATGDNDSRMEHGCLKTIAAFLNTKGGTLVIGVNDEGEVKGVDADHFPNEDKMALHLVNLIKRSLGAENILNLDIRFDDSHAKRVLLVECHASNSPVYTRDGNQEFFYVRTGPATTSLEVSKVQEFIRKRFIVS